MEHQIQKLGYLYGPATLQKVEKFLHTMRLTLEESFDKAGEALYEDCIYWQIDLEHQGTRFLVVEAKSLDALLAGPPSPCLQALYFNTPNIKTLLTQWDKEGMSFFVHYGAHPGEEYLVVAQKLTYRRLG